MQERRRFPRVEASAPLFARPLSRDPALARGTSLVGSLIDASRGGVAFACDEAVEVGDLVQLDVRNEDGRAVLERFGRVVACAEDLAHGHVGALRLRGADGDAGLGRRAEIAPAR